MALKVALNSGMTDIVSQDGSNPITTTHLQSGSTETLKIYIFNDDGTKRYEEVKVTSVDATAPDESGWIQFALDNAGVAGTFVAGPLSLPNISNSNTATPIWIRVTTTAVTEAMNKTDIKLKLTAKEFAV